MKTKIATLILIGILGAVTVPAKSPVRCMSATSLGVEYISLWRGQTITEAAVPSHELIQQVAFNYAPVEYIQFLFGLGMDRFKVETYKKRKFDGNFGFSFTAGAYANSPAFKVEGKDILRLTGGIDLLYLNCKDDAEYKYSGPVLNPHVGILAQLGPVFDLEAGVKWHFIDGAMENTETKESGPFSNNETMRGYFAMTLASKTGAYARFNFDVSRETTQRWKNGPSEASIGFAVGFIMKTQRPPKKSPEKKSEYFPGYEEMKKKQDAMAEDMADEINE